MRRIASGSSRSPSAVDPSRRRRRPSPSCAPPAARRPGRALPRSCHRTGTRRGSPGHRRGTRARPEYLSYRLRSATRSGAAAMANRSAPTRVCAREGISRCRPGGSRVRHERGVAHDREAIGHLARGCIVRAVRDRLVCRGRAARQPGEVPDSKKFEARLNGFQEVPSVSSTGFGNFEAELVNDTTLHYVFHLRGPRGRQLPLRARALRSAQRERRRLVLPLRRQHQADACPNVEGTVEGDVTPADVIGPNGQGIEPSVVRRDHPRDAGRARYANIHTTRWPGGEIRGQINDNDQREFDK